jgi:hypothetical protein
MIRKSLISARLSFTDLMLRKTYGSIPGIEVGTWWETREGCSADSIHASVTFAL